ncbi:MscL family protein [Nocardia beijingensis]|uniref:MscL family protein n=1 Tax=Nocardia beijingensis TaxID=95162 RepID=UPI0018957D21|nr:MscL family protein [Nocardia beijingensis]MBF6466658.1 MscL family protein [Nocardia beijingensis]
MPSVLVGPGLGFRSVADQPATCVQVGPIITAAINFLIIAALPCFVVVLPATRLKKCLRPDETTLTDSEVLIQIRDLLAEGQTSAGGRHEFRVRAAREAGPSSDGPVRVVRVSIRLSRG